MHILFGILCSINLHIILNIQHITVLIFVHIMQMAIFLFCILFRIFFSEMFALHSTYCSYADSLAYYFMYTCIFFCINLQYLQQILSRSQKRDLEPAPEPRSRINIGTSACQRTVISELEELIHGQIVIQSTLRGVPELPLTSIPENN
jgi:hypothetical protein